MQRDIPEQARHISVVPNGVDTACNRPGFAAVHLGQLVYSGALTYEANYDAMSYFLREIFPRVREGVPEAVLYITGPTAGVALERLAPDNHVVFTGYLDDVRPMVASSSACVVPLRIGGGSRLKILEAMALGTPVISTSKGAEGLEVTAGEHLLLADAPADFAAQTVRLLRDSELRASLSERARKLVEERYDWCDIGSQFVDLVEATAKDRLGPVPAC